MRHDCYVETDARHAEARVPTLVAELNRARRERLERIGSAAYVKPAPPPFVEQPEPVRETWVDRQKALPIAKAPWFSVVADLGPVEPRPPQIEDIRRAACKYFDISRNDILSPRRDKRASYPRHVLMFVIKTLTLKTLPEIGRRLGGRDHTTILHGIRKIERLVRTDWEVAFDVAQVEAML